MQNGDYRNAVAGFRDALRALRNLLPQRDVVACENIRAHGFHLLSIARVARADGDGVGRGPTLEDGVAPSRGMDLVAESEVQDVLLLHQYRKVQD